MAWADAVVDAMESYCLRRTLRLLHLTSRRYQERPLR